MRHVVAALLACSLTGLAGCRAPFPASGPQVDASSLDGKLLFGYQGWFGCPEDGSGLGRWEHWFRRDQPAAADTVRVDMWPDVSDLEGASGLLWDAVEVLPTPGHTSSHHSLRFDCDGLSVVTAGDAVPTRDFWRERRGYFNSADLELSARTMDKIAGLADLVVPGHDNYFLSVTP